MASQSKGEEGGQKNLPGTILGTLVILATAALMFAIVFDWGAAIAV
jgi:hypothetical protein